MKMKIRRWYKKLLISKSPPWFDKAAAISSIIGVILSLLSFSGVD